ncbi:hypothetical protein Q9L58_010840, partial [Maublancomyces gigas]
MLTGKALIQSWHTPLTDSTLHILNPDGSPMLHSIDGTPILTSGAHQAYLQDIDPHTYLKQFRGPADNWASSDTRTRKRSNLGSSSWSSSFSPAPPYAEEYIARIRAKLPTTPPNLPSESDYEQTPRPIPRAPEVLDDSEVSEGGETDGEGENAVLLIESILKSILTLEKRSKTPPSPTKLRNNPTL